MQEQSKHVRFRDIAVLIRPFFAPILLALLWNAGEETLALVFPYIQKLIMDIITEPELRTWENMTGVCATLAAAAIIHAYVSMRSNVMSGRISHEVARSLDERVLGVQVQLSLGYHARVGSSEKITVINKGTSAINNIVTTLAFNFVPQIIRAMCILAFIAWYSPAISGIIVFFLVILAGLVRFREQQLKPVKDERHKIQKESTKHLSDIMSNMRAVQTHGRAQREIDDYQERNTSILELMERSWRIQFREYPLRTLVRRGMQIGVILYGFHLILKGEMTLGTAFMCMNFGLQISDIAAMVTTNWTKISELLPDVDDFMTMLHLESDVRDPANPLPLEPFAGTISFEHVSFSYPERKGVLDDVHFTIPAGSTVAFVGKSGSGKTTIATLLARGYDVHGGRIMVDGKDVRDIKRHDLWNKMGVVPQEAELFQRTIAENIAYGNRDATMEQIIAAAKLAEAHEFIMNKRVEGKEGMSGYQAIVGERGVNFSGGEKQRLMIARAILKNPAILVMDEATSHLDGEVEEGVKKAIVNVSRGRTTIIIAHRLSTIQHADKIIAMKDGKIMEEGTHNELRSSGGYYSELCKFARLSEEAIH